MGNSNNQVKSLKAKDYKNSQEIRWCPGCGDYAILNQFQSALAELSISKDKVAIISGIGCSARLPYYMDTYGIHSIHGRAPAIATGLRLTRPELSIWVVTGDGDGLAIGGNHMLHILRRNLKINILLFNNQIYGLTKGQYSPTTLPGKITKSTPDGSQDYPLNPIAFALGSGATFVARSLDRDVKHLKNHIVKCEEHKGTAFLEIYQNCNIFNDGVFSLFSDKETKNDYTIFLENEQPLVFGSENQFGIILNGHLPERVEIDKGYTLDDLWIHDEEDLFKAQILARFFENPKEMTMESLPRPFGVFYREIRPCHEEKLEQAIQEAKRSKTHFGLNEMLEGSSSWIVK